LGAGEDRLIKDLALLASSDEPVSFLVVADVTVRPVVQSTERVVFVSDNRQRVLHVESNGRYSVALWCQCEGSLPAFQKLCVQCAEASALFFFS